MPLQCRGPLPTARQLPSAEGRLGWYPSDGGPGGFFLTPIPVPPGDPGALSSAAGKYTAAHGEVVRQQALLKGAAGQAAGAAWTGVGAANYVAATTDLVAVYGLTGTALATGRDGTEEILDRSERCAEDGAPGQYRGSNVQRRRRAYLSAQAAAEQAQTEADDAATASTTATNTANAHPHSVSAHQAADSCQDHGERHANVSEHGGEPGQHAAFAVRDRLFPRGDPVHAGAAESASGRHGGGHRLQLGYNRPDGQAANP